MHAMRRFIRLIEGQHGLYTADTPLWHGTDLISLAQIIASNELHASIDQLGPHQGVSLTHDLNMAWSFARRSSDIEQNHMLDWFNGEGPDPRSMPTSGGVLEFDTAKLRAQHRLVHYTDHTLYSPGEGVDDEEREVRVLGDVMPVSPYLTAIYFNPNDIPWFISYLRGNPRDTHAGESESTILALTDLLHHPLRRETPPHK